MQANDALITSTPNLIIDIRNNGGGADASYKKIIPYPSNVAIMINENNASIAEQFLLEAKQSKKVKLFGANTFGALDISNMAFVMSPCKEFELGYSLSESFRIPDFMIDNVGLQPDYYIDKSIPQYKWINFVQQILENH
ncbi:hypothetical protein H7F33_11115 [Pedobacter sp. PAMC26386]|nr:hypothetical protein H7F33_11115 [Pedobacter sp. PAMC26386]